ncbi:hypothetical protein ACWEOG_37680, partial [Amycolatopsis japonica]
MTDVERSSPTAFTAGFTDRMSVGADSVLPDAFFADASATTLPRFSPFRPAVAVAAVCAGSETS